VCERSAPVDVRDEEDRRVGGVRGPHVGEVRGPEVGLRRTPRTLEEDELELREQIVQCLRGDGPERRGSLAPAQSAQAMVDPAEDHDLAPVVGFRLDEDRVHPHVGLDSPRDRLQVLRGADLPTVDDPSVQGHVLRLERRNAHSAASERTSQSGNEETLPRKAGGPLDRERAQRGPPGAAGTDRVGTTATLPSTVTTWVVAS
jgi:hypothetical protein